MLKILAAQIREENYYSLRSRGLFSEKAKGCYKGTSGRGELPNIVQLVLNESNTRRKNLAMVWIDNKKVYDMAPQSWIINCLKLYKISNEVIKFIEKNREN